MNFLECDLEDLIYECSLTKEGRDKLLDRGLYISRPLLRQVKLSTYGVADLIEISGGSNVHIDIIELKKGKLEPKDYLQLCRYMTAIKNLISLDGIRISVSGILIGKEIKPEKDFCYLINEGELFVYTYDFDIEKGLRFNRSYGWYRTDAEEIGSLNSLLNGVYSDTHMEFTPKKLESSKDLNKEDNE